MRSRSEIRHFWSRPSFSVGTVLDANRPPRRSLDYFQEVSRPFSPKKSRNKESFPAFASSLPTLQKCPRNTSRSRPSLLRTPACSRVCPLASLPDTRIPAHSALYAVGDKSLPTVVLLHSFSTSHELFEPQFTDPALLARANFVAIDLFGHGGSVGGTTDEALTYWEQAKMVLEVLDALVLSKVFIMGTSQGGFVAARVALLQPERVLGLVLLGTSLLEETSAFGSWDIKALLGPALPFLQGVEGVDTPDFVLPQAFTDDVIGSGYGTQATEEQKLYVRKVHEKVFVGDAGRKRYLMIALYVLPLISRRKN